MNQTFSCLSKENTHTTQRNIELNLRHSVQHIRYSSVHIRTGIYYVTIYYVTIYYVTIEHCETKAHKLHTFHKHSSIATNVIHFHILSLSLAFL